MINPYMSAALVQVLRNRREDLMIDWRTVLANMPHYLQAELKRLRRQSRLSYERLMFLAIGEHGSK
jgi:hypothetical protein